MKFSYQGKVYDFDVESLSIAEAREVKQYTGMALKPWQQGLEDADADAIAALVYTAVRREGGQIEWADLDSLNLVDFVNSMIDGNNLDRDALARGEVSVLQNRAERRAATKPPARRAAARK